MAKTKVDEWDTVAANNADIDGISILGTAPASNMDNAVRELMAQVRATPLRESAADTLTALGVNVPYLSFNTHAALRAFAATTSETRVIVRGTMAAGDCAHRQFLMIGTGGVGGDEVNGYLIVDATGRKWEAEDQDTCRPYFFEGATDDIRLQAFFDDISATLRTEADWGGVYSTATALVCGPASGSMATLEITGKLKLTGTSAMDTLLEFRNINGLKALDPIELAGTGSTSNSSRTIFNGMKLTGTSGRCQFGPIRGQYFGGFAVAQVWDTGDNLNFNAFGTINAYDCGSGYNVAGYTGNKTANVTARSDTGSSNSFGQLTVLTVDAIPPAGITDLLAAGTNHIYALFEGNIYFVKEATPTTVSLFPWVEGASTTGTIDYIYGGAFLSYGSDANNAHIKGIDAARCGIALADCSLYGASCDRLQAGTSGVGHSFGIPLSSTSKGGIVNSVYMEGDVWADAIQITSYTDCNRVWVTAASMDEAKLLKLAAPRSTSSSGPIYPAYSMLNGLAFPRRSRSISYEPHWETISDNAFNSSTTLGIGNLGDYDEIEVRFEGCTFAAACSMLLRLSADNGSTFAASSYVGTAANNDVGTASTTSFPLTDGTVTAMAHGVVRLSAFKDSSRKTQIDGIMGGIHKVSGIYNVAARNNGLQLIFNSQTWTAGNIVLRGLR